MAGFSPSQMGDPSRLAHGRGKNLFLGFKGLLDDFIGKILNNASRRLPFRIYRRRIPALGSDNLVGSSVWNILARWGFLPDFDEIASTALF